jgi:hypothetical protein
MCIDLNTIPSLMLEGTVPYDASVNVMSSQSLHNGSLSQIACCFVSFRTLCVWDSEIKNGLRWLTSSFPKVIPHRSKGGLHITTTPSVIMLSATRISCAGDGRKTCLQSIHHDKHWFYGRRNMSPHISLEYSLKLMYKRAQVKVEQLHRAWSLKS